MKRTPLLEEHARLGAKLVEFAGWEMPLYYAGIVREVEVVRSAAGVFDVSHMGELIVRGAGALDLVQYVTTNDASSLEVGKAQYTLLCDDEGGVIDDLIVLRLEEDEYLLVVNASNTEADREWIRGHNRFRAELRDLSGERAIIALQGPASQGILRRFVESDLTTLRKMHAIHERVGEVDAWISRSGYTGEDGFELFCASSDAVALWRLILEDGAARPAGLGARDVLRIEAGLPLYGHELTRGTTPVDARLMWVVHLDKGEFLGRRALLDARERGPDRTLVGLSAEGRCIPREGHIVSADGAPVGHVTSGTYSPTLEKSIAMAYVHPEKAEVGLRVEVDVRGRPCPCRIVSMPFYKAAKAVSTVTK